MSIRRKILLGLSVAAVGLLAQTANASAAVRPMTFDECGTNGGSGVYNCMYISGGGLSATEIRGWSTDFSHLISGAYGTDVLVHEEVTAPNGTICNSDTVTLSSSDQIVSCQLEPGGSFPIAAGTYCSILWWYDRGAGAYENLAENCGTASS
ncbi:MAG: hypothetical protein ABSA93_36645 [Streptosporangiaceae bacterium]|jgi:hypothetical protein